MRDIAYLILALAVATPAKAAETAPKGDADSATRRSGGATVLDLRVPAFPISAAPAGGPPLHGPPLTCGLACGPGVTREADRSPADRLGAGRPPVAAVAPGALAWTFPGGLGLLAAGAFGQTTLFGRAGSPLDTAVAATRTSAALFFDLPSASNASLRLKATVESTWRLDGPDRATNPLCGVRLDLTAGWTHGLFLHAPCGPVGHFGFGVRGWF